MKRMRLPVVLAALLAMGLPALPAEARIKLITLPVRQRVEIQLDNPNATLVEEERIVPLVKGVNQVDFSWANTQIDANTLVFRVLGPAGDAKLEAKVLSVSYPPGEAALVWQVAASESGSARVRISYLLGNLTKSFNYRASASHDEKTLTLWQYMRIQNLANEEYLSNADPTQGANLFAGYGRFFMKPIGLNETKELLVEKYTQVPVVKTYSCNPHEFGWLDQPQFKLRVPMHYVLKNNAANQLGKAPLPYGKARIFIEAADPANANASSTFLGEDWAKFTPVDDELKLFLGVAQDVVVKRTVEKSNRIRVAGSLYHHEVILKYEIENAKDQPVILDVIELPRAVRNEIISETGRDVQLEIGSQTDFEGGIDKEKSNFGKVVFHVKLPPRDKDGKAEKIVKKLHLVFRNEW